MPWSYLVALLFTLTASVFWGAFLGTVDRNRAQRPAIVIQERPNECGLASLKMILDAFRIPCSMSELRENIPMTSEGMSMLVLKRTAELRGLHATAWHCTSKDLRRFPMPAVLFVERNHFVVVDSMSVQGQVFIRDPRMGRMEISEERLSRIWGGQVLVLER